MGYKPKKWPSYALESLENSLALTQRIDKASREAQEALVTNNPMLVVLDLSDIRQYAQQIRESLVRSRAGDYPDRTDR